MLQHDITSEKYYWYGVEITAERYAEIREMLNRMPEAPEGYFYVLTEELEWELREAPEEEGELTAEEIAAAIQEALS